jgi:three-Cys-motif partner protein
MAAQRWAEGFIYVDAFAGAGHSRVRRPSVDVAEDAPPLFEVADDDELADVLAGSPAESLCVTPAFTRYVFLERDRKRAENLERLRAQHSDREIAIEVGDSNTYLSTTLIRGFDWRRWRAVVFVDPFGMQVPWSTLEALASTGAIEVFINFPVNMAIQRLLKRSASFTEKERQKLDEYFGDRGWYDLLYTSDGLFGPQTGKLSGSTERLVTWYRDRLRSAFGYVSTAHLVSSTKGRPLYYLIHAGPNATGASIANHVLRAGARVGGSRRVR